MDYNALEIPTAKILNLRFECLFQKGSVVQRKAALTFLETAETYFLIIP